MPTFGHFGDDEQGALLNYLRRLAAVPESEAAAEISVTESPARVGELLVRGTCHICHDATKVDAQYSYTRNGEPIPPLSSFHQTIFIQQAIRKVRMGSPVPGGRRGRMPVFSYLTEEEIMAAYSYLATRPPQP
jgi:mono/diheme cytochrome c family protein